MQQIIFQLKLNAYASFQFIGVDLLYLTTEVQNVDGFLVCFLSGCNSCEILAKPKGQTKPISSTKSIFGTER